MQPPAEAVNEPIGDVATVGLAVAEEFRTRTDLTGGSHQSLSYVMPGTLKASGELEVLGKTCRLAGPDDGAPAGAVEPFVFLEDTVPLDPAVAADLTAELTRRGCRLVPSPTGG